MAQTLQAAFTTPILLIVVATVCWGLWGVLTKLALSTSHPAQLQLTSIIVGLASAPAYVWLLGKGNVSTSWNAASLGYALTAAAMTWLASLAYLYALQWKDASVVTGLTAAYPLVAMLVSAILLGESLTVSRCVGMACLVCGIFLVQS